MRHVPTLIVIVIFTAAAAMITPFACALLLGIRIVCVANTLQEDSSFDVGQGIADAIGGLRGDWPCMVSATAGYPKAGDSPQWG
jgi:hypothetical protein